MRKCRGLAVLFFILLVMGSPICRGALDQTERFRIQNQGAGLMASGDLPAAIKLYRESRDMAVKAGDWSGASWGSYWISLCYGNMENYAEARKEGVLALEYSRKSGENDQILRNLHHLAEINYKFGQYDLSRKYIEESRDIVKKNPDSIYSQRLLALQALISWSSGDKAGFSKYRGEAADNLKKEMEKWEKDKNPFMVYIAGWKLIGLYQELADYGEAIKTAGWLIDYCSKNNLTMNLPLMYRTRGAISRFAGDYNQAFSDYKKAMDLLKSSKTPGNDTMIVTIYQDLSEAYSDVGRYDQAAREAQQGLKIIQAMDPGPIRNMLEPSFHMKLGRNYLLLGRLEWAKNSYNKALELYIDRGDLRSQAMMLFYLAQLSFEEGKDAEALELCNRSVDMAEKAGSNYYAFQGYMLKARILEDADTPELSLEELKKALKYQDKLHTFYYSAMIYLEMAELEGKLGRMEQLKKYSDLALKEGEKISRFSTPLYLFSVLDIKGRASVLMGDRKKALVFYQQAVGILEKIHQPQYRWRFYYRIGQLYEKEGQPEKALEFYRNAIKVIEEVRSLLTVDEFRVSFSGARSRLDRISVSDVYEAAVRLMIQLNKNDEAFNYSERARSRALLDMLNSGSMTFERGASSELLKRERELKDKITGLAAGIDKNAGNLRSGQMANSEEMKEQLEKLKSAYSDLMVEIKLSNRELYDMKTVDPAPLSEIMSIIPQDGAILEYLLTDQGVRIFIVKKDGVRTAQSPTTSGRIHIDAIRLRAFLTRDDQNSREALDRLSDKLSQSLIHPAEDQLEGVKTLIIVPNKVLHFVPFAVLKDKQGKYLARRFQISYSPSASVAALFSKKTGIPSGVLAAFALGNKKVDAWGIQWSPLPGTRREVETVSSLFPEKVTLYSEEMTKAAVEKLLGRGDVIHFATHGLFDANAPLFSGLVLADGILSAKDIFGLKLKAGLVVLSACQTGLGRLSGGDDIIGLSRAFMFAGAPSIVVSLWSVSDESTTLLMESFYKHLKSNSRARALQLAQLELMDKGMHPFHWAPFVLIGEFR